MWTRQHKQRNTGRFIVPAISVLFLSYFGFHAYNGEYGIYSKYQLEARRAELAEKLDGIKARRMDLEQRVRLLHDGSLEKQGAQSCASGRARHLPLSTASINRQAVKSHYSQRNEPFRCMAAMH